MRTSRPIIVALTHYLSDHLTEEYRKVVEGLVEAMEEVHEKETYDLRLELSEAKEDYNNLRSQVEYLQRIHDENRQKLRDAEAALRQLDEYHNPDKYVEVPIANSVDGGTYNGTSKVKILRTSLGEIIDHIKNSKKIQAIKTLRTATINDVGLRDAKVSIEQLEFFNQHMPKATVCDFHYDGGGKCNDTAVRQADGMWCCERHAKIREGRL